MMEDLWKNAFHFNATSALTNGKEKKKTYFSDITLEPLFFSLISLTGRLNDAKDTHLVEKNQITHLRAYSLSAAEFKKDIVW